MQDETFGQRFLRLRKEKGLTQEETAKRLNVSSQAVSKWETDSSMPDIALLSPISDMFETTIDDLMGKSQPLTSLGEKKTSKDMKSMILRMKVISSDGDKVNINLPVALISTLVSSGQKIEMSGKGSSFLKNIDLKEILSLIESGVIGHLMDVHSADGDVVEIDVE